MIIQRQKYLKQLIEGQGNGLVKIVIGGRRCGKSFLLFTLFHDYLIGQGVDNKRKYCLQSCAKQIINNLSSNSFVQNLGIWHHFTWEFGAILLGNLALIGFQLLS